MFVASLSGVGAVLRLERDAWSMLQFVTLPSCDPFAWKYAQGTEVRVTRGS